MNKVLIIGIIIAIGIIMIGISLSDTSKDTIVGVTIDEGLDTERKSYSVSLTESMDIKSP